MDKKLNELYNIAESNAVTIDTIAIFKKALSVKYNNKFYIGLSKKLTGDIETRHVLAEELGHCCTNSFYAFNSPSSLLKSNVDKAERQARDWTINTLIPLKYLISSLKDNFGDLYRVAEDFDTNLDFVNESIDYYKRKSLLPTAEELGLYDC